MSNPTIDLTRAQRDVLYGRVVYDSLDMNGLEYALRDGNRDKAVQLVDRAALWVDILNQVGWQAQGNEEMYTISVAAPALRGWLSVALTELADASGSQYEDEQERAVLAEVLETVA